MSNWEIGQRRRGFETIFGSAYIYIYIQGSLGTPLIESTVFHIQNGENMSIAVKNYWWVKWNDV